jgi:16S rRNA processing protein RimM
LTDFPQRFSELAQVFVEQPELAPEVSGRVRRGRAGEGVSIEHPEPAPRLLTLERAWPHKGRIVLKLGGVDSIQSAAPLRGKLVLIPREKRAPLPPHHYYLWELIGCRVVRECNGVESFVGTVADVEPTGGVDLLLVSTSQGEVLIPLAQAICTKIDASNKTIVIDPPEGLLEL